MVVMPVGYYEQEKNGNGHGGRICLPVPLAQSPCIMIGDDPDDKFAHKLLLTQVLGYHKFTTAIEKISPNHSWRMTAGWT